ncbi:Uncharacterised protein [Vibrio cholerae]|uniref:Uncharacterized protein n=1 Tax=Vibrio cholerae TaxID=666 RepID=A0A655W3C2_VIBCL|nr:Uncharacterised protein [Vibrio cholerae]CSA65126.1 Uncharacterised protein [Vibrio cholerae]CSB82079.1 Uncharacterised protein [Vibrio cholerae]CSC25123.1 Uncharacterised protein [Vibrio cholerae]CSC65754.1 Uncharacterised protein [Vibrio cholerae]
MVISQFDVETDFPLNCCLAHRLHGFTFHTINISVNCCGLKVIVLHA